MKKAVSRKPPTGAPEGTMWFGGPVDRWRVALRVYGEELVRSAEGLSVPEEGPMYLRDRFQKL